MARGDRPAMMRCPHRGSCHPSGRTYVFVDKIGTRIPIADRETADDTQRLPALIPQNCILMELMLERGGWCESWLYGRRDVSSHVGRQVWRDNGSGGDVRGLLFPYCIQKFQEHLCRMRKLNKLKATRWQVPAVCFCITLLMPLNRSACRNNSIYKAYNPFGSFGWTFILLG